MGAAKLRSLVGDYVVGQAVTIPGDGVHVVVESFDGGALAVAADQVTLTTEFDLVCQDRLEGVGGRVLAMTAKEAGDYVQKLVVDAAVSAVTKDDRVTTS